jgi:hypothetical protein
MSSPACKKSLSGRTIVVGANREETKTKREEKKREMLEGEGCKRKWRGGRERAQGGGAEKGEEERKKEPAHKAGKKGGNGERRD